MMPKPCDHIEREPKCRVCELYATDDRYRAMWDGESVGCVHKGDPVRVHGSSRDWRSCSHPDQPLGPVVCSCKGCGPKCAGYTAG